jgi:hypothetical protein
MKSLGPRFESFRSKKLEDSTPFYSCFSIQETTTPTIQYQRGNFLVATEEDYKNLTTYMCGLYDYYMAQATEMEQMGFKVIIRKPLVFYYPDEKKHFIS